MTIIREMFQSFRYAHLSLRIGLAFVFLWFGVDKFIHPEYWASAWLPSSIEGVLASIGISPVDFMYLNGIVEVLIGASLILNVFIETFSFIAIVFLIGIAAFHGFNEIVVRDIGLISGFLTLIFWPTNRIR